MYVRKVPFAYFGGYDIFNHSCGYLVLYQLLLCFWGYLSSDSWKMSHGSYVYVEKGGPHTYHTGTVPTNDKGERII